MTLPVISRTTMTSSLLRSALLAGLGVLALASPQLALAQTQDAPTRPQFRAPFRDCPLPHPGDPIRFVFAPKPGDAAAHAAVVEGALEPLSYQSATLVEMGADTLVAQVGGAEEAFPWLQVSRFWIQCDFPTTRRFSTGGFVVGALAGGTFGLYLAAGMGDGPNRPSLTTVLAGGAAVGGLIGTALVTSWDAIGGRESGWTLVPTVEPRSDGETGWGLRLRLPAG